MTLFERCVVAVYLGWAVGLALPPAWSALLRRLDRMRPIPPYRGTYSNLDEACHAWAAAARS